MCILILYPKYPGYCVGTLRKAEDSLCCSANPKLLRDFRSFWSDHRWNLFSLETGLHCSQWQQKYHAIALLSSSTFVPKRGKFFSHQICSLFSMSFMMTLKFQCFFSWKLLCSLTHSFTLYIFYSPTTSSHLPFLLFQLSPFLYVFLCTWRAKHPTKHKPSSCLQHLLQSEDYGNFFFMNYCSSAQCNAFAT